jgi:hypothetical protein
MRYYKKAKNAERLGLRSSISFFQLKDELGAKVQFVFDLSTYFFTFLLITPSYKDINY